jgi:hypothetical protein
VAIQEVRWDKGGSQPGDDYIFFYRHGNANHHLGTGLLIHKGIISTVKRIDYISDSMSYVTLKGRCDISD